MSKIQLGSYDQKIIEKQHFWSQIITEWQKDKITPSAFCKDKNINKDHFYYWRRRIEKMHPSIPTKNGAFIEISSHSLPTIDKKPQLLAGSNAVLEIMLPNKINIMLTIPTLEISKIIHQLGGMS